MMKPSLQRWDSNVGSAQIWLGHRVIDGPSDVYNELLKGLVCYGCDSGGGMLAC